ncbi:MAG: C-GCAxxG-C-C family protein [Oscillospiraceae bacterium]|jgi:hypothetical protein|nr:C-GCAxxG-C-C family protein [Oscillospiraceae bacterium]
MTNEALQSRVTELYKSGLHCSQVMMLLSQELRGEDEPTVISAMGGLAGGLYMGLNCGTLSGGACLLASYCARGSEEDSDSRMYKGMVVQLVDWFNSEFGALNCSELVSPDRAARLEKCPTLLVKTFEKCLEILQENGIDPRE